jgi:hypothetical protein
VGILIGGVALIAFALWTVIAPRQQWQVLNAWRYRDPDANEPSDLSYNLGRAAGVGTILLVLVLGFIVIRNEHSPEARARDARELRKQRLGVSGAELTAAPPAGTTGAPITIWRYASPDDKLLAGLGTTPPGTDLIIAVDGALRADAVTVAETADQVTVTLRGGCAPTTPTIICDQKDRTSALSPLRLFPLDLAAPLGGRRVIDGATGEEAIGR